MIVGRFCSDNLKPGDLLVFRGGHNGHLLLVERKQDSSCEPRWSYMNSKGLSPTHVMEWTLLDRLNTGVLEKLG